MPDEVSAEKIVTKFILDTCRLRPQLSRPAAEAAVRCVQIAVQHPTDNEEDDYIPLTTGSVAEFYIEPMLPHIGDIDVMYHHSTQLAIPRGHPPPTQLPAEFHNSVEVYEITDSHLPGYVYLVLRYFMTECVEDGKYNAVKYDREIYELRLYIDVYYKNSFGRPIDRNGARHGPADHQVQPNPLLPTDGVPCMRCLVWPSQAADWPTRHRSCGWPDSSTVDCVVSNGCDVVGVAHRQCRQHEWMGLYQHRLSFSRAEIVLINSWMPVQQIAYHMLRVFVKTERLTESAENCAAGKLSNYHLKTLMLWACELKPKMWWNDDSNLVRICVHLLHVLGGWLTDARCRHYFINNCNLIDCSLFVTNVGGQLMSINEKWLSRWFVCNYVQKCSGLCPYNIYHPFDNINGSIHLQDVVSAVVGWRQNNTLSHTWRVFLYLQEQIIDYTYKYPLTAQSCVCWMTKLAKIYSHLSVYFTAAAFLHVAHRSSRHGINDELVDIVRTFFLQLIYRHHSNISTSLLSLDKAAKLMKFVANKPLSTMSLIAIELSKAYLYRALRCEDSNSDSIYCLANVYLAVLFYATGQYQTAIDHCTLVMISQDHSRCSSHVVQGQLLTEVNENVHSVLGLAVFYKYVLTAALNQREEKAQYIDVLSTKLFAYYLSVTLRRQFKGISTDEFERYKICIRESSQLLIGDVLLFVSLNRLLIKKCYHKPVWQQPRQRTNKKPKYNSSELVELLQKSAVEHLTAFRQILARDFGSLVPIVTTDFEALYAYKRGDYQQCLQLSTQNVHMLLHAKSLFQITTYPEFAQLMDDDIVSLTALTLIADPKKRLAYLTQLTLSLYLMIQCQLKLCDSVTALTQTLGYTKLVFRRYRGHPAPFIQDQLVLKMISQKALMYISTTTNKVIS